MMCLSKNFIISVLNCCLNIYYLCAGNFTRMRLGLVISLSAPFATKVHDGSDVLWSRWDVNEPNLNRGNCVYLVYETKVCLTSSFYVSFNLILQLFIWLIMFTWNPSYICHIRHCLKPKNF